MKDMDQREMCSQPTVNEKDLQKKTIPTQLNECMDWE